MTERVLVSVDLAGLPVPAGVLHIATGRALSSTFQYTPGYLARKDVYPFDPLLPLRTGASHVDGLPGAFADAAPDRWGRNLIRKRLARSGGPTRRALTDLDFLLEVSDETRQGAVRFSRQESGPYLAAHVDVPKLIALPTLLRAAERVATDEESDAEVKLLLDAGTGSLGGARPKASVLDGTELAIAKFPHPGDRWDVMAWEATALDLATMCGIDAATHRLLAVGGRSVLLVRRFDRAGGLRVGYMSAMSLTSSTDGDAVDYLQVAEAFATTAAAPRDGLRQLWRRIAFGTAISNTDDHLRNLGLLRGKAGWRLAPAFDLNPNPEAAVHQTTIAGESRREGNWDGLIACAGDFALADDEASRLAKEVSATVRDNWRTVARSNEIAAAEIDRMSPAFG